MRSQEAESLAAPVTPPADMPPPEMATRQAEAHAKSAPQDQRSVIDDIEALIDDARTYFDAELRYQKSRAAFVTDRLKRGIGFVVVSLVLGLLAAVGLTVGLIIALTPLITAWGATAVVVLTLLLIAFLLVRAAAQAFSSVKMAFNEDDDGAAK